MPTFTTEGVIIKRSNFGEADRLLTVLTPYKGKIRVLAKGVRRITSRRGGNVESLNQVKLHLFLGKQFFLLTEAISISTFSKLKDNLILSGYASHLLELCDRFLPENQPNPAVYELLVKTLNFLQNSPRQIFIRAFEVKLLSLLGFWSLNQIDTTVGTEKILKNLQQLDLKQISNLKIDKIEALEVEQLLRYYIEKILEAPLRSMKVIKQLK